jgi:hypothetical protein
MKIQLQAFNRWTLFFTLAITVLFAACELDDPFDPNNTIDELTGDWTCFEESSLLGSTSYNVIISPDPLNLSGIQMDGFYDLNGMVDAIVSGNSLTIPEQTTPDNYTISGSGTISGNRNTINLQYAVDDNSGGPVDNCTAVYEAQ